MKLIIKLFSEITVKSASVRMRFIHILARNIRNVLKNYHQLITVIPFWDHIDVCFRNHYHVKYCEISRILMYIPGIQYIMKVEECFWNNMLDIYQKTFDMHHKFLIGKTFCVRVKRLGKHTFTSQDIERYLGCGLKKNVQGTCVNLINPEYKILLQIYHNKLIFILDKIKGLGGFPIGTQQNILSLISGGFDSAVSSYMLIKRGCRVHYCFFNFFGEDYKYYIYNIVYHLWSNFSVSHSVMFVSIDFYLVTDALLQNVNSSSIGVVLKRMMIRAASMVAKKYNIKALSTGEVLGQVSSQTLQNLHVIDKVSDKLILRPLISYNKEDIIRIAREIGTERFSKYVPEYCGLFSKSSVIYAIEDTIIAEEKKFDFSFLLFDAIKQAKVLDVSKMYMQVTDGLDNPIEVTNIVRKNDIILDIRPLDIANNVPVLGINMDCVEVKVIPFYKLVNQFMQLDKNRFYLLYCDRGVMSRIQARFLYTKGFKNVKVYRP
ncbi:MAG: tRNA uridine 4-sulfurtransferase [Candidatus Westeberhardia cardiocondylae]|nr:tRNA uridine 4-sulfurtransferase [Candidatus Westeberhardia cardiocondylae]